MTNTAYFRKLLPALILLALAVSACGPSREAEPQTSQNTYQTLTIDQFADILANEPDQYTIVNVHIPYEGHLDETDLTIPYNDIPALTSALPDKDAPIILYCRSGRMSAEAGQALAERGYTQVWDVPGGMNAWRDSGRELIFNEP